MYIFSTRQIPQLLRFLTKQAHVMNLMEYRAKEQSIYGQYLYSTSMETHPSVLQLVKLVLKSEGRAFQLRVQNQNYYFHVTPCARHLLWERSHVRVYIIVIYIHVAE